MTTEYKNYEDRPLVSLPAPSVNRYLAPAIKAAIAAASLLIFLLVFGSLGYPFGGSIAHGLFAALFFISNVISLFYYIAQIIRRTDHIDAKARHHAEISSHLARNHPEMTREMIEDLKEEMRIEIEAHRKKTRWILYLAALGLVLGAGIAILDTWFNIPLLGLVPMGVSVGSVINGTLFVLFTGGMFLSLGCRLWTPEGKSSVEQYSIYIAAGIAAVLAIVILASLPSLLPELSALSKFTVLGANVFISALFAIIGLSSYIAKAIDYFFFYKPELLSDTKTKSTPEQNRKKTFRERFLAQRKESTGEVTRRLWEHRFSIAGLIIGGIIDALIIILNLHPFGPSVYATAACAILALSACASIASKIGRGIDESLLKNPPQISWLSRVVKQTPWAYFARIACAMGLFTMLGFSIYAFSPIAVPGGFLMLPWALGSPAFAFGLAALSVACISNWVMGLLKPSVKLVVMHQAVTRIDAAQKLIRLLQGGKADSVDQKTHEMNQQIWLGALLEHVTYFRDLFNEAWRDSLVDYSGNKGEDFKFLNDLLTKKPIASDQPNQTTQQITLDQLIRLNNILIELKGTNDSKNIDFNYRPNISRIEFTFLTLLSVVSFIASTGMLLMTFTGGVSLASSAWVLSLTALYGVAAWGSTVYLLNRTRGSAYASWGVVFSMAAIITFALGYIAVSGIQIAGANLASMMVVLWPVAILCSIIAAGLFYRAYKSHISTSAARREDKQQQKLAQALTPFKIVLALGFLTLAFLALATLFNLQGLGLLAFAKGVITQALGVGGEAIGLKWLGIFSIGIFAASSFIAFELFKNVLKRSPTSTEEFSQNKDKIHLAILTFKFIFTSALIITLTAVPSVLMPTPYITMLPVFLVVMVVMPIFSSDADLPFKSKFPWLAKLNDGFNHYFGLSKGKFRAIDLIKKELRVLILLAAASIVAALVAGVAASIAAPVAAIGGISTLLFRWGKMEWETYHDPIELADNTPGTLQANKIVVPAMIPYSPPPILPAHQQSSSYGSVDSTTTSTTPAERITTDGEDDECTNETERHMDTSTQAKAKAAYVTDTADTARVLLPPPLTPSHSAPPAPIALDLINKSRSTHAAARHTEDTASTSLRTPLLLARGRSEGSTIPPIKLKPSWGAWNYGAMMPVQKTPARREVSGGYDGGDAGDGRTGKSERIADTSSTDTATAYQNSSIIPDVPPPDALTPQSSGEKKTLDPTFNSPPLPNKFTQNLRSQTTLFQKANSKTPRRKVVARRALSPKQNNEDGQPILDMPNQLSEQHENKPGFFNTTAQNREKWTTPNAHRNPAVDFDDDPYAEYLRAANREPVVMFDSTLQRDEEGRHPDLGEISRDGYGYGYGYAHSAT